MNVLQISGNLFFRGSATGLNLLLEDCIDCTHFPSCLMCSNFYFLKEGIAQLCGCLYIQMLPTLQWFQGNKLKCKTVFYTPHIFFCKTSAVALHQVHRAPIHHQLLKADAPARKELAKCELMLHWILTMCVPLASCQRWCILKSGLPVHHKA